MFVQIQQLKHLKTAKNMKIIKQKHQMAYLVQIPISKMNNVKSQIWQGRA